MFAEDNAYKDFIVRSQNEPRFWNEATFGKFEDPWSEQWKLWHLIQKHNRIVCKAGRGVGKSFLIARAALWFLYSFPPAYVIVVCPTFRQVNEVVFKEIRTQHRRAQYDLGGKLYEGKPELKLDDDWKILGFSTAKSQSEISHTPLAGFHGENVLFIIDEAADSKLDYIFDAAANICTSANSKIIACGNPIDSSSEFAKCFSDPSWKNQTISVMDSPNVKTGKIIYPRMTTLEWVEDRRRRWGEKSPKFQCNVLATFPVEGKDTLIPFIDIERARHRSLEDIDEPPAINNLGVDVARYGDDLTSLWHCLGPRAYRLEEMAKKDNIQVGRRVHELNKEWAFKSINVDDVGLGGGTTDYLRRVADLKNVKRIIGQAAARNPRKFFNARSEHAWMLRERFVEKQDIIMKDEDCGAQLSAYKYEFVPKSVGGQTEGVYKLEEKKSIKQRLGRSPDDADSLIMANATGGRRRISDRAIRFM